MFQLLIPFPRRQQGAPNVDHGGSVLNPASPWNVFSRAFSLKSGPVLPHVDSPSSCHGSRLALNPDPLANFNSRSAVDDGRGLIHLQKSAILSSATVSWEARRQYAALARPNELRTSIENRIRRQSGRRLAGFRVVRRPSGKLCRRLSRVCQSPRHPERRHTHVTPTHIDPV
ncbi:hypothetical protein BC834DRAFT_426309 [Gloeopeniophorella convolvens]|nr:hypothetical protein BC834DRAFT_426309 [Gloeopeniophorella convolvens]